MVYPSWWARITACTRSRTPSLAKIRLICVFTVAGERCSAWLISPLERPSAIALKTSRSRGGQNREALSARDGLVAAGVGVDELPCDAGRHDGIASSDDAYGVHEFLVCRSFDEERTRPRAECPEGVLVQVERREYDHAAPQPAVDNCAGGVDTVLTRCG